MKKAPTEVEAHSASHGMTCKLRTYFNDVLMLVNLVLRVEPRPLTTAMMARLMPAAIKPYSIAVAADSSFRNLKNIRDNPTSWFSQTTGVLRLRGETLNGKS